MHITKPEENRMTKTYVLEILNFEDMGETIKKIAEEIGVNEPILKQVVEKKAEDFATFLNNISLKL
jgi:hypothetical protein